MKKVIILLVAAAGIFSCSGDIISPELPGNGTEQTKPETPTTPDEPEQPEQPEQPADPTVYIASQADFDALGQSDGGEIVFRNGTYSNMVLTFKADASESKPLVIRAETPGGVIFEGTSRLIIDGKWIKVSGMEWRNPKNTEEYLILFKSGSSHCTLSDCKIDGSGNSLDAVNKTKWVNLYGSDNVVEHCSFTDKKDMGALLVVWLEEGIKPSHIIRNNYFTRPSTIMGTDGEPANEQETLRIGDSNHSMQDAACSISGNYFYQCNGEAQEIISNKCCGNTYSGNLIEDSRGSLTLRHGNECIVDGNIFLGNNIEETGGIRIIGEGHKVRNNYLEKLNSIGYKAALCIVLGQENPALAGYFQVKDAEISENTFVDCKLAMHLNYGNSSMTVPCENVSIKDNIAVARNADGSMNRNIYVVRYENTPGWPADNADGPKQAGITFSGNKFFGRFKNNHYSLTAVSSCPSFTRPDTKIQEIKSSAGIRR